MTLGQGMRAYIGKIEEECEKEKNTKKKVEIAKKLISLYREAHRVHSKEMRDLTYRSENMPQSDIDFVLEDCDEEVMSDEEYEQLRQQWEQKLGEKLLYPEEQEYIDGKEAVLRYSKGEPEDIIKGRLECYEDSWKRRQEDKGKESFAESHRFFVQMLKDMTPEEYDKFMYPENDRDYTKIYGNVFEIKPTEENN